MRWQPDDEWIEGPATHQALVDPDTVAAVARRFGSAFRRTRRETPPPVPAPGSPSLRHRRAQAPRVSTTGPIRQRQDSHLLPLRVRRYPVDSRPSSTVYVREDAIVPKLDAWLAEIVTPEALAAAQTPPPDAESRESATRAAIADCDLRIERLTSSVKRAGMPIEWISARGRQAPRRMGPPRIHPPRPKQLATPHPRRDHAIADALGGLVTILENASPSDRAAVYQELGVKLSYDPAANQVRAGVGGGT